MDIETIALIAAVLFGLLAALQVALALGAPLGHIVYGGRVASAGEPLPGAWRVASGAAALVLVGFAWIILARGGVLTTGVSSTVVTVLAWMVVAYMAINTAMNLASRDPIERYLLGGATAVLVGLCAIVAAAGPT